MQSKHCVFILFLLIFSSAKTAAQCPINVLAGDDLFVCQTGDQITLNGSVSGNYLGFAWTPAAGLDDPLSLNPNATVTGPQTYTLNGFAEDPNAPNLVVNPAFENGNSGFFSTFTYDPTPIFPGTYYITTSPSIINSNFPPCDDHTFGNGTGNMMFVNGTGNPSDVWCQSIAVNPNSYYVMSGWVTAAPLSPPTLQFSVNGVLVGSPFASSGGGCSWEQFSASWFSGPNTSITLCITDQSSSGNGLFGDFFALDDIYFAEACSASDEVTVDVLELEAVVPVTVILACNELPGGITLDGSASSSGPGISYQWTTGNGNIVSGENTATPTVNAEGIYTLTVSFNNGLTNCTTNASVEVLPDPNFVFANANAPLAINCNNPTVSLDGGGSSEGPTISYEWSPTAGIISGETTLYPEVAAGGTYTLTVTNAISGCTATATVTVLEDTNQPTAAASAPGPLSCLEPTLTLSGAGSSSGGGFSYLWIAGSSGHIVSGETTLNNCVVDSAGIYQLTVTNLTNGCVDIAQVTVSTDINLPTVAVSALDSIDCENTTAQVSGNGSSQGSNTTYLWTTGNGQILSGANQLNATVGSGGYYLLTVTNNDNGCEASDSIFVFENTLAPAAVATAPDVFNCLTDSLQLIGSGSSPDSVFVYAWTTNNGLILNGETTLTPFIGAPGAYVLLVTDTTNNCTATDTANVLADLLPPVAEAGDPLSIGCDGTPESLDGSNSSAGPDFTYLWETSGGNILSGETTLQPLVNAPGTYILTTTNTSNGCLATDSVIVSGDGNAPTLLLEVSDTLSCSTLELTIDGSGSSGGPGFVIFWETTDGHFVSGETTLTPIVDEGGTYTLTLSDTLGNCTSTGTIQVVQDTLSPEVHIMGPATLNCDQPVASLDATASSQGSSFSQNWTTLNGHFLSGQNTLLPIVDSAGVYVLTISNSSNGCISTDSVQIAADFTPPVADAGLPQVIDCTNSTVTLDGALSSQGPAFTYQWTTGNGNLATDTTTLFPAVDAAGSYQLTVTNSDNGCTASSEVIVSVSADFPQITIDSVQGQLNCLLAAVTVSATAQSNPGVIFQWSTLNGSIATGSTSLNPTVTAPGVYVLMATDTTNGCVSIDSTLITQSVVPPVADAGAAFTLPCGVPAILLDGTASDVGPGINYNWTTPNGNLIADADTQTPGINAPGTYLLTVTNEANGCTATDTVVVAAEGPVADAGPADSLTCLVSSLILDGSGSESGPDLTYLWTTPNGNILSGATTLTPSVDAAGTYLLTVTNTTTNCETIASVQVIDQTAAPLINLGNTPVFTCADTVFTLAADTPANSPDWLWSTQDGQIISGENSPTPTVAAPGNYTLTVTNQVTGCSASQIVVVAENTTPPMAAIAPPDQLTCTSGMVLLDGSGSSAGAGFSFLWETPDGNIPGNPTLNTTSTDTPGQYSLTVTDLSNGCTAFAEVTVSSDTIPPNVVITPPLPLGCGQATTVLDGSGSGTSPDFSYSWSTQNGNILSGQTTLMPLVDAPGDYILQVIDQGNGCIGTATITVVEDDNAPEINILPPNELTCSDPVVVIDANGSSGGPDYQFNWTTINGNMLSGQTTLSLSVDAPGLYTLTIINTQNGCTASDAVTVPDNTTPPQATAGMDLTLGCDGQPIAIQGSLTAPANAVLTWDFVPASGVTGNPIVSGGQTPTPLVNLPGTYTLLVTDPVNGCTFSDAMTVTASGITDFTFETIQPDCEHPFGSIAFTGVQGGQPPFAYAIDGSGFASQTVFENLLPGSYQPTVQDADGCQSSYSAQIADYQPFEIVLNPTAVAPLGTSMVLNAQVTLPAAEIASIAWSPAAGLSCTDCLSPTATPNGSTTYLIEVVDQDGCSAEASIVVSVSEPRLDIFVPNAFSPNGDGINDLLVIFANGQLVQSVRQFRIFNRWGGAVYEAFNFPPNDFTYGWDGSHRGQRLDSGVFVWLAEVELADGSTRQLEGEVMIVE